MIDRRNGCTEGRKSAVSSAGTSVTVSPAAMRAVISSALARSSSGIGTAVSCSRRMSANERPGAASRINPPVQGEPAGARGHVRPGQRRLRVCLRVLRGAPHADAHFHRDAELGPGPLAERGTRNPSVAAATSPGAGDQEQVITDRATEECIRWASWTRNLCTVSRSSSRACRGDYRREVSRSVGTSTRATAS